MTRIFVATACLFVILAGIKAATSLVVPFLPRDPYLAILLAPLFIAMKQKGFPARWPWA